MEMKIKKNKIKDKKREGKEKKRKERKKERKERRWKKKEKNRNAPDPTLTLSIMCYQLISLHRHSKDKSPQLQLQQQLH